MEKAILIDATERTITEVQIGDWQEIAPMLGASLFTCVGMQDNTLYIDDEGLLVQPESFFYIKGYSDPLATKGLIIGDDGMGGSKDTNLTVEDVQGMVRFPSDAENAHIASIVAEMF
jgi:hypothetical protein